MHVYPEHLGACPWCALENQGIVYFVDLGTSFTATSSGFVLTKVWGLIQAVQPPAPVTLPHPGNFTVTPQPLPAGIPGNGAISFYRFAAVAAGITLVVALPSLWFFALLVSIIGWGVAGNSGSSERAAEKTKRMSAKEAAKREYEQVVALAKDSGPEGFHNRRAELSKLKVELEQLPKLEKEELEKLHSTAQARQKHKFLERCYIDSANIPGVGPTRKATLRSFGIETAADVSKTRVMQVRGFGESLARSVVDWKASCERRFVFNPVTAVSSNDKDGVRAKFAAKRIVLEKKLSAAPSELQQYRQRAANTLSTLLPAIESAAKKLAQADADLRIF